MSQTVITLAFEQYKAQQEAIAEPVALDEFVLANVPNQDASLPIDRNEGLPPQAQIVLVGDVSQAGYVNPNAVVYSLLMDTTIGDFDFNWIGLRNKVSGVIAAISHIPTVHKLKTVLGVQNGNSVTRSIMMSYSDAKGLTNIDVDASTWQIDFTARLFGMDEAERLANIDVFGQAAFLSDGFKVEKSGSNYIAKSGRGYVSGLRCNLDTDLTLANVTNSTGIYLDASWQGQLTSEWQTVFVIKVSNTLLVDYVDGNGYKHYVTKIADVDGGGNVIDVRYVEGFAEYYQQAAVDDLLDKKIDKASITDSVASTSSILVASAKGLKAAFDKAVSAYNLAASKITQAAADVRYLSKSAKATLTDNDGKGNANLTFNHKDGVPIQDGSSARVEVTTDVSTAEMTIELGDDVKSGTEVDLTEVVRLTTSEIKLIKNTTVTGDLKLNRHDAKLIFNDSKGNPENQSFQLRAESVDTGLVGGEGIGLFLETTDENESPDKTPALFVEGGIYEANRRVYSPNNKPVKADVGLSNVNNWLATTSVSDSSTTKYAIASAVKTAYDKAVSALNVANAKWTHRAASTAQTGTSQLSDSVTSTSSVLSATAKAVKTVNDLAKSKMTQATGDGRYLSKSAKATLTDNDGHGNANLTFNHKDGVPLQSGSSYRLETATDGTAATATFEMASNVVAGTVKTLTAIWIATMTAIDFKVDLKEKGQRVYSPNNSPVEDIWLQVAAKICPVGVPMPWPTDVAPAGFAIMKGQAFSSSYTETRKAYPSGVLPDMRGLGIVGKSDGELILAYEEGQVKNHGHPNSTVSSTNLGSKNTNTTGNHNHSFATHDWADDGTNIASTRDTISARTEYTSTTGNHAHSVSIGSHAHSVSIALFGASKNTIDNRKFNWIVRLA